MLDAAATTLAGSGTTAQQLQTLLLARANRGVPERYRYLSLGVTDRKKLLGQLTGKVDDAVEAQATQLAAAVQTNRAQAIDELNPPGPVSRQEKLPPGSQVRVKTGVMSLAGPVGPERCRTLAALALEGLAPDLTLVLDVPPGTGTRRALGRGDTNRFEAREQAFHERVRQGFRDIVAAEPERCAVLDATDTPHAVLLTALAAIRERLGQDLEA